MREDVYLWSYLAPMRAGRPRRGRVATMGQMPSSAARRSPHRPEGARTSRRALLAVIPALLCVLFAAVGVSSAATGRAARTFSLTETGHLRLTSKHGFTLNEQGTATGTISGTIYIHLHIVSTNRVTAEVNIYPRGGSLTGEATASYHPAGAVATFSGKINIVRGSGGYSHARGSGLSFTGTVRRIDDAVTVRVSGRMSA
jgi:hypothetical protein